MLNKYIYVNQETFKASGKQNSSGIWLCDKLEVTAKDKKELDTRYRDAIDTINGIHNEYNKKEETIPTASPKKKKPKVKGLE